MWDFIIQKHGQNEFQAVYFIISSKYKKDRFSETAQKGIAHDCGKVLAPLGMTDPIKQQELIGLVSSFMIMEEAKYQ